MSYSLAFSKAVISVLFIADKVRQGHYEYVPTRVIAKAINIPSPTLVKISQSLIRSGLVESKEGIHGGLRLSRRASDITVLDILMAVEMNKPLFRTDFNLLVQGQKPEAGTQAISNVMTAAENAMHNELKKTTVADLMKVF
jgi:Rrf2 family protein